LRLIHQGSRAVRKVDAAESGRQAPHGILGNSGLEPEGCLRVLGQTLLSLRVARSTRVQPTWPSFTSVGWDNGTGGEPPRSGRP